MDRALVQNDYGEYIAVEDEVLVQGRMSHVSPYNGFTTPGYETSRVPVHAIRRHGIDVNPETMRYEVSFHVHSEPNGSRKVAELAFETQLEARSAMDTLYNALYFEEVV